MLDAGAMYEGRSRPCWGTESEPLRIKEKTKRRQRRLKKVKSKHRYTILKIREVVVKELAELEKEA